MALDYGRTVRGKGTGQSAERPPAPANTQPEKCAPTDMEVGDYIFVGLRYRRVNDMRSRGGATERVLVLEGFGPWVMTISHLIHRPIKRGRASTVRSV